MFLALLIETYKTYKNEGLREPTSVIQFTKDYQQRSDVVLEYLTENVEHTKDKNDLLTVIQFSQQFRMWHKENFFENGPGRNEISAYLTTYFKGVKGPWKGYRIKQGVLRDDVSDNEM